MLQRRVMELQTAMTLVIQSMMSYFGKLTGEDLSCYLNKIESVGLRKSLLLAPDR